MGSTQSIRRAIELDAVAKASIVRISLSISYLGSQQLPGAILHHLVGKLPIIQCEVAYPASLWTGPNLPIITVNALVDTGADLVVIDKTLIKKLGLPPVGTVSHTVVGSTIPRLRPKHRCDIIFQGQKYLPPHGPYKYTIPDVEAIDDSLSGFDIILGWNALDTVDLHFSRDGTLAIHLPDGIPIP